MSHIVIKGGKILQEGKKKQLIEITYTEQMSAGSKPANMTKEDYNEPRKQLKDAFTSLAVHAAVKCEFIPSAIIQDITNYNPDLVKDFRVTGFSIGGSEEDPTVKIYVVRTLKSGDPMGFNSQNIRLKDESYVFHKDLLECVETCEDELMKYLNGEYGVAPGEINFKEAK